MRDSANVNNGSRSVFRTLPAFLLSPSAGCTTVGIFILLSFSFGFELWKVDRLPAVPIYFLILIPGMAWFMEKRRARIGALLVASMSFVHLFWRAPPGSYTAITLVGRGLTFLIAYLLVKPVSTARLMLNYLLGGGNWGNLRPFTRIGRRIVVITVLEDGTSSQQIDLPVSDIPIRIQRGKAFGNASHPTTRMCLALIEDYLKPGASVFDLGCGTGVLAIAAAKLGAGTVLAVDLDPETEPIMRRNLAFNELSGLVEYRRGSLEAARSDLSSSGSESGAGVAAGDSTSTPGFRQFDLVLANILTSTLLELLEEGMTQTLSPSGVLILSGIRTEEAEQVVSFLPSANLELLDQRQQKGWVALAVHRSL